MARTPMARPNPARVEQLRKDREWSREDLARRIGRTRQAIWLIETGKPVSETIMRQVAKALKVPLAEITLPEPDGTEGAEPEAEAA